MKNNILKSLFIALTLVLGVNNAWAVDHTGGYVYFLKPSTWTGSKVMMFIGHNNYTSVYEMTKVSNTDNLYRYTMPSWGGATYVAFANAGSAWGSGSWGPSNRTNAPHYTNVYNDYGFNSGSYYVVVPASTSNNAGITINYKSSASNLNLTTRANVYGSTDGGSTYASMAAAGTVSVSGYYMSNYSTASTRSAVSSTASQAYASTTLAPGSTATFKATAKTGYEFVGWFTAASGGTAVSTDATYTFKYDISYTGKTLYARFKQIQYTVSYGVCSTTRWGSIKLNSETAIKTTGTKTLNYGTSISFTATPDAGYQVEGWYSNSGCTSKITAAGTSTTYDAGTLTADKTVYVKFEAIPANNHNITYTTQAAGWTYGAQPTSAEEGATVTFEVIPTTGYTVTVTSSDVSLSNNGNIYTFTMPTKDVTINVSATEKTHDVTVLYKSGDVILKENVIVGAVGEANAKSIEAPAFSGYAFTGWTLGSGITNKSANTTTNPIDITTKASGEYTLTANYEKERCVYFVNTARWTTINAYAWLSSNDKDKNGDWPGKAMTKEPEQIGGYDVYKYVMPAGKTYDKIIFNNKVGDDGVQTGDLDWVDGKYYVYSAEQWVDKNEVADLLPKPVIYFKNHLGWKEVYVYFHTGDYWSDANNGGSGAKGLTEANGRVCLMEKVGETDIYKYDYEASGIVPGNVIAFTKDKQPNYDNFWQTEAAYRSDYNPNMELFVPQATSNETKNETKYYNKGIWMKYNSIESGYSIAGEFNDWKADPNPLVADGIGGYSFYTDVQLEAQTKYQFKILNINNDWFGKKSTNITSTTTSDIMLEVGSGDEYNVTITPQTSGTHTFTIDLIEGKLLLHVEYPVTSGDYRIVYAEKENGSTYSKFHITQTIQKEDETTKVSAFVDTEKKPFILLQKWNDGWITTEEKEINLTNFPNLKGNGVYNFWVSQTNGEATIHSQIDKYTGSYYIRTNCANGGWRKYLTQDNAMTYSQKALIHGGYDYYYCKWIQHAGSNISYTIANDYSFSLSDTLTTDDIAHLGILPASAYVRFTWNSQTNKLARAYIGDSVEPLAIKGEGLKDAIGADKNELIPTKSNEWQYQVETKANANTNIQVVADYNSHEQYLKGTIEQPEKVISGNTTRDYLVRLTYDFRTNQLISTLIDNNEISDSISINSIIISREHHNAAQSINITSTGSINNIENATAIITFAKETLNNISIAETERALYWISFPFSVKLSEVTGNGTYGEHWILEEYDGKARAENGCWAEDTYWKYIEDSTDKILYPHMGYVLALDLTKLGEESDIYDENGTFTIHFPSYGGALSQLTTAPLEGFSTIKFPEHKCTINRPTDDGDRRIKDSNWNIIGVPSFANVHDFATQVGDVNFYYQWNPADDTYSPQPAATFQTMHAYMVQFAGTIDWGAKTAVSPAAIAARRNAASKDQYTLRLVLQQEGKDQDQTFIRLLAEGATNDFDMNVDLSKIINRGANIYSLIGKEEAAANVLPIEESIIPIGVDIAKTGTYTFAMPDGTDGITAILIDYETQTEHNLLTTEYTVDLNKGISNKRFALRVLPHHVATNIESLLDGNCNQNVQKYIINGQLFIKNNGHIYDIQGREVK